MAKRDRQPDRAPRRYEVPFGVQGLPLANAELGIGKLQTRPSPHSYAATITIVDAPDHRLVRAGVLLAHRVIGGVGEWYLSAPAWQPYLPAEDVEAQGGDDVPERFADITLPFRRRAALGPVATITYKRVEYIVGGTDDRPLATLCDERGTIRRGGLATARFRQATLTPLEGEPEQVAAIDEALQVVGGQRVAEFPTLAQRMGTPATGLSDFPAPRELDPDSTLEMFVGGLIGWHLHALMLADVAVRPAGSEADPEPVRAALRELAADLEGLRGCLDQAWLDELEADIAWVCDPPEGTSLSVRLGERYLGIIDRLVRAARAPKVGALALRPAGSVLAQQAQEACVALADAGAALHSYSPDEDWAAFASRLQRAESTAAVAWHLFPKQARRLRKQLDKIRAAATVAIHQPEQRDPDGVDAMTPAEAFEAGRACERALHEREGARVAFCAAWPKRRRKLLAAQVHA